MADQFEVSDTYGHFIDGEMQPADGGTFETIDPATEVPIAEVAAGNANDVDDAVADSIAALDEWQKMPPAERGRIVSAIAEAIQADEDRLAYIETLDSGKPLSQALTDVRRCARYFEYYAGVADKIHGDSIPRTREYVDYTVREPLGVTAHIVPWNFPIGILGRGIAPALVTGNVAIAKPAEQTPLTAVEVAKLAVDVGLPPGVLNVITGFGPDAGEPLVTHPDVEGITFTGSVETGRQIAKQASEKLAHVHLELGGKNANVIFPDADLDDAIENTVRSIFSRNTGQVCTSGSRAIVHQSIHDEFIEQLARHTDELTIGPGVENPDVGPLASAAQFEKVTKYIDIGRAEASDPVIGGSIPDRKGYFVEPTVFTDVNPEARIAREEIFGPVLVVITFSDEREALAIANESDYGLVAGVFTSDIGKAHRFARDVDAGQVYINEWFASGIETPFGGYKQSGLGRAKGLEALREYTQVKTICARIDD
ncbi:aldehyde dehydrogenase family protein [Halegenticoccus tardaugens]|uniref:aldehyde dehydrogenase family protein n=1 Tax=Halegenticoccus tardaugens TaxID=2071624 RepID=UPI00100B498E|nr:aldehyde dehydrogenase family protein [Halegenticoccus tardaugens]